MLQGMEEKIDLSILSDKKIKLKKTFLVFFLFPKQFPMKRDLGNNCLLI